MGKKHIKYCLNRNPDCLCATCKLGNKLAALGRLPCCVEHGTSCPATECKGYQCKYKLPEEVTNNDNGD